MDVTLPHDLDAFVRQQVAEGRYDSPDEVVREGLRLLEERERYWAEVRRKVDEGLKSLDEGKGLDGREVMDELLRKLEARAEREKASR